MHPAALPDADLLAQCDVERARGSGPGGRHRNSTESRVVLRHRETGAQGMAGERRSQHENLAVALFRLRCALAAQVRVPREPAALPTAAWLARVRGGRYACNPEHREFPSLLAEALDAVAAHGFDVRPAAESLHVSATQLVRFVALHHPALDALNRGRAERGMSPLRG